jgi:hypothetical protein
MPRIANREASSYALAREPFDNHNETLFGEWRDEYSRYIVYSYGYHWPLYIYDTTTEQWYENESRYSRTTSRHRSQARPTGNTVKFPVETMKWIASHGVVGAAAERMAA